MTVMRVVGVDGAKRGWVAVVLADGEDPSAEFHSSFGRLLAAYKHAEVIAVDIPIGIPESGTREADAMARKFVGRRASSVFEVPPRAALEIPDYPAACELARRLTGKGISKQAHALRDKILEVGVLVYAGSNVHEVHPEVSFRELAGHELKYPKSTLGRPDDASPAAR